MGIEKTMLKKASKIGLGAGIFGYSYMSSRKEGYGGFQSGINASVNTGIAAVVSPGLYIGGALAVKAPEKFIDAYEKITQTSRAMSRLQVLPFSNGTFVDNKQVFTMRQAGVSAMQQSKYNTQNALLANEASFFHK